MPDAKRFKPVAGRPEVDASPDPRAALAAKYLQKAGSDLAEKEAAAPRSRRPAGGPTGAPAGAFSFSIAGGTFVHVILAAIGLTFAALAATWCYVVMMVNFTAGRVMALPLGVVIIAVLSYLSVCLLGIIESTSVGRTDVESLQGDWREWFWTLPSTLGMVALAAAVGWGLSLVLPISVWTLIAVAVLLLYPILQLSSLETGSPLAPLSLPVLQSIPQHPLAWFVVYAISLATTGVLGLIGRMAWHDPPYVTILILGPFVTVALFFYAWLLGQLAHLISRGKES